MASRFRPSIVHAIGCIVAAAVAVVLLLTVLPDLVSRYFPQPGRLVGLRGEGIDFLLLAIVPAIVWLVPPLVRGLAHLTHHTHRLLVGRAGFYVRFPRTRDVRFRDTVIRSLGPFSIDLLVIAEIEYFLSGTDVAVFTRGLFAIPFLLLAGLVTSLMPGPWLADALDLRLVDPHKGEVVREAAIFEGLLGPIGALALLVSFVTLAHTVGDSYEQGIILLALWAVRMVPAVLLAASIYRIAVEPDVLPSLAAWAEREGIEVRPGVEQVLESLRSPPEPAPAGVRAPSKPEDPPA